jgi:hypothetical protein
MFGYKTLRSLLMAAVVMVAIPSAANAQAYTSKIWSFDVGGGYAIPLGGLSDIAKGGPMIEVGFGYAVSELVGLRLGTEIDLLKGQDVLVATPLSSDFDGGGPNITIWHLNGGIDFDFINKPDSKFKFQLYMLGGAAFVNSQKADFRDPNPTDTRDLGCENAPGGFCLIDWQDAYPEFSGGIRLGFEVGDCTPARARVCGEIGIFGGVNMIFGNEEDTEPITSLYANASPFGSFQTFPVGLNIRINVL